MSTSVIYLRLPRPPVPYLFRPKAPGWALFFLLCPLVLSAGLPGEPVAGPAPELREPVRQMQAARGPDGTLYLMGHFETVGGIETGGVLRLGPDGGVAEVMAKRLIPPAWPREGMPLFIDVQLPVLFPFPNVLFPLEDGRLLVSHSNSTGWGMIDTTGELKPGFLGEPPPIIRAISPQFERDGHLYCVVTETDNRRYLVRQPVASESWDPVNVPSDDWPLPPTAAIPEADSRIRVLGRVTSILPIDFVPTFFQHDQKVFLVEADGSVVPDVPVLNPGPSRQATLIGGNDGRHKIILAPDNSSFRYWPTPTAVTHRVEWRNAEAELERAMDFSIPLAIGEAGRFIFGAEPGGAVVATGPDGRLRRWLADGTGDESFTSPGPAQSLLPLPDGKWLINGTRRILADGRDDPAWSRPDLERPARVTHLARTPDGVWLTAGNFHRANQESANRLVKWNPDGSRADGFQADPRLTEIRLMEALPDGGVLIVTGFTPVSLDDGRSSHLVRLLPDGELDESFFPPLPDPPAPGEPIVLVPPPTHIEHIAVQPDGGFLVLSSTQRGDVRGYTFGRHLPDGNVDTSFAGRTSFQWIDPRDLLVLEDGSFFLRGALHGPDGEKISTVDGSEEGLGFRPLCQMPDGSVIFTDTTGGGNRLRRWQDDGWDGAFADSVRGATGAAPADSGQLLLWGRNLQGDLPAGSRLVRLHRNGRVDATFRLPPIERLSRRGEGPWVSIAPDGILPVDPSELAEPAQIAAAGWDEATGRIWMAGDFNKVGGVPCDGLAWLHGESASDYETWSHAVFRDRPDRRGPTEDARGDGRSNLQAYATGADPLSFSSAAGTLQPVPGAPGTFFMWLNPEAADVDWVIEISGDLTTWNPATEHDITLLETENRLVFALSPTTRYRFARIRFSLSPH